MKPEHFSDITRILVIFHFKKFETFYLTQAEDDRIAQEIQKKREMEENDSELVKNKVMVSYSFQLIFV